MPLPPQPCDDPCYQQFLKKLSEFTVNPRRAEKSDWRGPPFVLPDKLRKWLTERPEDGQSSSNVESLLEAVYKNRTTVHPPLAPELVLPEQLTGDKKCLFTFCILLELQQGHLIHKFSRVDLVDKILPLALHPLKSQVEKALNNSNIRGVTDEDAAKFAVQFNDVQWKYFPVEFDYRDGKEWPSPRVFPFLARQLITDKGATARVYEVAIPETFVKHDMRKVVKSSGPHPDFKEIGQCYHFAIKVFRPGYKHLFDDEIRAYQNVQRNNGMVKYLGDFSHEIGGKISHNILLEYAEIDLSEYFLRSSPVLTTHIERFWTNLFQVPSTVQDLHDFEKKNFSGKNSLKYKGWHADIKPDNILLVQGKFKLADPGFARFQKQQDDRQAASESLESTGGTTTYGAPERFDNRYKYSDPSKSDIWSIGCVLSEAAAWVVLGRLGVDQFAALRRQAVETCAKNDLNASSNPDKQLGKGDFFHDGHDVLPIIKVWHNYLRSMSRPSNIITNSVLDLVEQHLLLKDPSKRFGAKQLCEWWAKGIGSFRDEHSQLVATTVPPAIEGIVTEEHAKEADRLQGYLGSQSHEVRRRAKSSALFLHVPGQEQSVPPSIARRRSVQQGEGGGGEQTSKMPPALPTLIDEEVFNTNVFSLANSTEDGQKQYHIRSRGSTGSMKTRLLRLDSGTDVEGRMTIFDAYYEKQHSERHPLMKRFFAMSGAERLRKDQKLERTIQDRDLVFLVDNSESMLRHWSEVAFVLEVLTTRCIGLDDDGMDLRFTDSKIKALGKQDKKDLNEFRKAMFAEDAKPVTGIRTDMSNHLHVLLETWLEEYRRKREKMKSLTIYVLTDGKWEGMANETAIDNTIVAFNEKHRQYSSFARPRHATIQFISFGNDSDALYRMRRLDNDLVYKGVPDIVDTEPSNGDIYQMLLGSITPDYDKRNDILVPQTSPPLAGQDPRNSSMSSNLNSSSPGPQSDQKGRKGSTSKERRAGPFSSMIPDFSINQS